MKLLLVLVACAFMTAEGRPSADFGVYGVGPVFDLPFIVGGRVAEKGRWPWYLALEYKGWIGWSHSCGAVLIGEKKAITAAHCVHGRNNPNNFRYKSGLSDRSGNGNQEQTIGTTKQVMHPDFDMRGRGFPNDIATVHLKEAAKTNQYVKFATLPNAGEDFVGKECWITGFGKTHGTNTGLPSKLYEAQIAALTTTDCNNKMPSHLRFVTDNHLCVFGDGERGSCGGDSGGPLQCKVGSVWKVTGVTSYGIGNRANTCLTEYPSVYTRVTSYLDFIRQN